MHRVWTFFPLLQTGMKDVNENEKTCMDHVEFQMLFQHPGKVSDSWQQESRA